MGYMHIDNLYKTQDILLFKWCYALEKIHGTSAHVSWKAGKLEFFAGGGSHETFVKLFSPELPAQFTALAHTEVTVFGEFYGGKIQAMQRVYGTAQRFLVFDVKIGDTWLTVPDMDKVSQGLGLDVVPWEKTSTEIQHLDASRDAPSIQATKNGITNPQPREGIVIRPPIEVVRSDGKRIIAKHKHDAFKERTTQQKVVDPATLKVLTDAKSIAEEWVTDMRLAHVLDKFGPGTPERTRDVISAMQADVVREAEGEIVLSKEVYSAIARRTVELLKRTWPKLV